jgi:hypothetical protein
VSLLLLLAQLARLDGADVDDMRSAEEHDLALVHPDILADILTNFSVWHASILSSIDNESKCGAGHHGGGGVPFPTAPNSSSVCTFLPGKGQNGADIAHGTTATKEECCGACLVTPRCHAADFNTASEMRPSWDGTTTGGTCHLKAANSPKHGQPSQTAIVVPA